MSNLWVLNAIFYVAKHGCKWREIPPQFGNWHTFYTRMNRWSKNGVLDRGFEHLQREQILRIELDVLSIDSTVVKVHPDVAGASKNGPQSIGKARGGWTSKIHLVASDGGTALRVSLSPGQLTVPQRGVSFSTVSVPRTRPSLWSWTVPTKTIRDGNWPWHLDLRR